MPTVLKLMSQGNFSTEELTNSVADQFGLDDEQRSRLLPSGRERTITNRIRWARFSLLRAGLISRPSRGRYVINASGRELLESGKPITDQTLREISEEYRDWAERGADSDASNSHTSSSAETSSDTLTPDEQIDSSVRELELAVRTELLERIKTQSPQFFEQLVIKLMLAMGYGASYTNVIQQVGRTGDGGIDGVIDVDILGRDRLYLQAKRYTTGSVGRPELQMFIGALTGNAARDGVFVTTSKFAPTAISYLNTVPFRVALIDGERLADLMLKYGVGV
ncbi:restriction endonuclease [Microvirga sp. 2YAF29]|uniref:restriction endonuclease n=1 Tax=Microvirga sp. 2YAF29 TaxID=3233031 RepID=UPI003F9CBAF3